MWNVNMYTQIQVVLQSGEEIPATAKLENKNKDTNGAAAENGIWYPRASRVVIQDGTEKGARNNQLIN